MEVHMLALLPAPATQETFHSERRKWQRLPIAIPVFVRGVDGAGKEFIEFVSALNISAGGMLIAARRHVPCLTGLSLEIPSAPLPASEVQSHSVRSFKARAVRNQVLDNCHYVAFKFTRPLRSGEKFE
jgi:hypothetical protein